MKQQLFIIAGARRARFYDPDTTVKEQNHPLPPFASFFEAVWLIINADYAHYLSGRAEITIYYGDSPTHGTPRLQRAASRNTGSAKKSWPTGC